MSGTSNNCFLSNSQASIGNEVGVCTQSSGPVMFTVEQHGDIVRRAWWAYASTGTPQIQWIETYV